MITGESVEEGKEEELLHTSKQYGMISSGEGTDNNRCLFRNMQCVNDFHW